MTFGMDRLSVLVVARTTQLLAATLGSWGVELRYLRSCCLPLEVSFPID